MAWGRALALSMALMACEAVRPLPARLPPGTWGGEDAGLLVSETGAHVHIGCTVGTIPRPIDLDGSGRFDVAGTHNVDAFPVDRGILHPARFTGRTDGRTLSLEAQLTDTGLRLGPVTLTLGRQPRMRGCPICAR